MKPTEADLERERPWNSPEWAKLSPKEMVTAKLLFPYLNGSRSTAANLAVQIRKVYEPRRRAGRPSKYEI